MSAYLALTFSLLPSTWPMPAALLRHEKRLLWPDRGNQPRDFTGFGSPELAIKTRTNPGGVVFGDHWILFAGLSVSLPPSS